MGYGIVKTNTMGGKRMKLEIFDAGDMVYDRYTVIITRPGECGHVIGMSHDPLWPAGFNQYCGPAHQIQRKNLGSPITFSDTPEQVQRAIMYRVWEAR